MAPFNFESGKHFVASSDGVTLQVYELTDPTINASLLRKTHWKDVATILADLEDAAANEGPSYDGLLFPGGHGKVEGGKELTALAQHLAQLLLMVSPEGNCFQDVTELEMYTEFDVHYLRLNDLFHWPRYGVVEPPAAGAAWGRSELKHRIPEGEELMSRTTKPRVCVNRAWRDQIKQRVADQKVQIEKLTIDMQLQQDTHNDDIRKLTREKDAEVRKVTRDKNKEIRDLVDKHDEEIIKLTTKHDDAITAKDDDIRKLKRDHNQELREKLRQKDDECRVITQKKDDDIKRLEKELEDERKKPKNNDGGIGTNERSKDLEAEVDKLKEDLIKEKQGRKDDESRRKEKEKECDRKLKEKDDDIKRLTKERDDAKSTGSEANNARLEKCRRESWRYYTTVKLLKVLGESRSRQLHMARRKPVPSTIFNVVIGAPGFSDYAVPAVKGLFSYNNVHVVDEENTYWPNPRRLEVTMGRGASTTGFDTNNWFFVKTTHPEGGLTMLAYYDGYFNRSAELGADNLQLPYWNINEIGTDRKLFLVKMDPFGYRVAFMFRV